MSDPTPRITDSFAKQRFMATLGATLTRVTEGEVELAVPYSEALTQQHGYLHAGAIASMLDTACGYAALTTMPEGAGVLSIEFKTNLLAPARGESFRFVGQVLKAGRTITVCEGRAWARDGHNEKLVATMTCTLMAVVGRGIRD